MIFGCSILMLTLSADGEVFLPGMQPREAGIEFVKVQQCMMCHGQTDNANADPLISWQSGMMSQAARDPVYRAAVAIANQDVPGVGEFCFRCHSPRAWLEDRSKPPDGSALNREDLHGVSCDVCHKFIDPLSAEAAKLIKHVPPSYGNAMMVADPENVVRGPYADAKGAMPHQTLKSDFLASGDLCGMCHNVSNPLAAKDVNSQPVHSFGHVERTYSEWQLSDFPKKGRDGTCQSCHYKPVQGGGEASRFGSLHRDYFVEHGPLGGSTWVQDAVWFLWKGRDISRQALNLGKKRTTEFLKTAAELELTFSSNEKAKLRITNKTGHKLPTGYPEGRRMWVNVQFLDGAGKLLREMGKYGDKQDTVLGESVTVPTLLDEEETTVYECVPGLSITQAAKFGKKAGPSFHFVLNDVITKDNRIPPEGFENERFAEHLCEPVGATYADGQYWDDIELTLPAGCAKVVVKLMYQSVSWEYIKFLAEENKTDDWGKRLYNAWSKTGKCEPTVIARIEKELEWSTALTVN
jgi:hypothetical protein